MRNFSPRCAVGVASGTQQKTFLAKIRERIVRFAMLSGAFFVVLGSFLPSIVPIQAAGLPYQALVSNGSVVLSPGEVKQITLRFKNVGTKTWTAGLRATAVYVYGKSSLFAHPTWKADDLPALIREATVKPGAMASAVFYVKAPMIPGTYNERFLLSYAPNAWIKNSVVPVTFTVSKPAQVSIPAPNVKTPVPVVKTDAPSDIVPASTEYKAQLVDKGGVEWQLGPSDHSMVELKFKNIGTKTWKRDSADFLSLYTWSPKYRLSPFKDFSWKTDSRAAQLVEAEVKPGQIGTIRLELRAPEVPGTYQETFQLAAEDKAWLDGGSVTLPINVSMPANYLAKSVTAGTGGPGAGSYNTMLMLTSQKTVTLAGNDRIQLTQGFKNAGTAMWNSRGLRLVGVAPALGTISSIKDDSWPTNTEPVKATDVTPPGQIGFVSYTIKAPAKKGSYTASFRLVADGQEVPGGEFDVPITVTADGAVDTNPIPVSGPIVDPGEQFEPLPLNGDAASLPAEPIIRVGLFRTTDDTIMARSLMGNLIVQQNGVTVCTAGQGAIVTVVYQRTDHVYVLSGAGCSSKSPGWFVLSSTDGISPLEITDYSRPVSWLPGANDNTFRGKLELRYTPSTDVVWVINELPFESYLRGIAETSNVSPLEFQKALLTAARTYGLYHINRATKHASEFFHVDAHLDQVYRGYGQEARSPNIVDGVNKTRGQIVTYDGKLAITPYFSRSDGRTRDWTEVWGGSGFPWLKSVAVPYDVGQTLWGHGVGLSARGALYMASKDNAMYDQILKHFYQGTELRKAYK